MLGGGGGGIPEKQDTALGAKCAMGPLFPTQTAAAAPVLLKHENVLELISSLFTLAPLD